MYTMGQVRLLLEVGMHVQGTSSSPDMLTHYWPVEPEGLGQCKGEHKYARCAPQPPSSCPPRPPAATCSFVMPSPSMIIVPVNPNGAASNEGVDLSSDRVILTSAILDPWALPQDGLYLEVIASVVSGRPLTAVLTADVMMKSRTNIDGKPSFFVAATDMDKKFHVTPFEDIPGSETAREALRARAVALPKEFTQGRRGADEADVDATVKSPHLDIGTPSKIPTFVASSKGDDGPDFFWDKVCPAAISA